MLLLGGGGLVKHFGGAVACCCCVIKNTSDVPFVDLTDHIHQPTEVPQGTEILSSWKKLLPADEGTAVRKYVRADTDRVLVSGNAADAITSDN